MRVALVHDWLTGMRGGERCLEALLGLLPEADLFCLRWHPGSVSPLIERRPIRTTFVQRLPGDFRRWLPLFPLALGTFDLRGYDLVVSVSHCVAKAARARGPHLAYCLTPMRYAWDRFADYFRGPQAWAAGPVMAALRAWDRATARRPSHVLAISWFVRARIERCWGRGAAVCYPPVDLARFWPGVPEDFDLFVGALEPVKRADLAVAAATRLGRRLLVVGRGSEAPRLRQLAGPTVEFLGAQPDVVIADLYRRCRLLLFPGVDEFGIVPVEALASGRPVVARRAGGAMETLGPDGCFFDEPTPEALAEAIQRCAGRPVDSAALRRRAEGFGLGRFQDEMRGWLREVAA